MTKTQQSGKEANKIACFTQRTKDEENDFITYSTLRRPTV